MKTLKSFSYVLCFVFAASLTVNAQSTSATANVGAAANVFQALSITVVDTLNFGTIASDFNGTVSIIATAGAPTTSNTGANATDGQITITGSASQAIDIDFADAVISDGTNTIDVVVNIHDGTNSAVTSTGNGTLASAIPGSGPLTVNIGGTMTFSSEVAGAYSTSNAGGTPIVISVDYQ